MKRDMWKTLRNVATGKAVVITTRESLTSVNSNPALTQNLDSMEEASALATKVGILAKKMLGKPIFPGLNTCKSN